MTKIRKTRNWAGIIYEDSAPENWRSVISEMHIPMLVSPLHDRDITVDGSLKKPHWHVVLMADGPITQEHANKLLAPLKGTKSAEYIKSLKGYVRYLAHLDDPDKATYNPDEIEAYNGADLSKLLQPTKTESYETIGKIIDFCVENSMTEFYELVEYARKNRPDDWFPLIINNAFMLSRYLTSKRHSSITT